MICRLLFWKILPSEIETKELAINVNSSDLKLLGKLLRDCQYRCELVLKVFIHNVEEDDAVSIRSTRIDQYYNKKYIEQKYTEVLE